VNNKRSGAASIACSLAKQEEEEKLSLSEQVRDGEADLSIKKNANGMEKDPSSRPSREKKIFF
jgi:hypothetical protein